MHYTSQIMQHYLSSPMLLSLVISIAFVPVLRRIGLKIGLVDLPGGRKQHKSAVPLIGGLAIFFTTFISLFIWGVPDGYDGMFIAATGLFLLGFIDDMKDISAKIRLFAQISLISLALWWDNTWISSIPLINDYSLDLYWFKYPLTLLCILGITNAINMLDGLDGLSSGIILIILGFIISVSSLAGNQSITLVSVCLFGSILGFWAYNYRFSWRKKASVFMGDSGTMLLGFLLPFLAIKLSNAAPTIAPKTLLLWLFAIPIWDIAAVIIKRIRNGKSPMQAGRDHVHHVLMRAGLSVRQTLHLTYLLTMASISLGVSLNYFGVTHIESLVTFSILMVFYLLRVGTLDKPSAEVYDFETFGDRRNILDSKKFEVVNFRAQNGTTNKTV